MPKPMLNTPKIETGTMLNPSQSRTQNQQTQQMDKMKLDRYLRQPRSKEYMEAMQKLDAGGHVHNEQKVNEIMQGIQNEFPEVDIKGIMLGIVSICYLGKPYEVHTLDITGSIIEHYPTGKMLPGGLEKARGIALRGGYEFIEVYVDCCRAISANGSVSVITC